MHHKIIAPIVVFSLLLGTLFFAASGRNYRYVVDSEALFATPQHKSIGDRRMVDMIADDSYLVDKGDSTIFILVGNFAAHHNGTVILADSAVRYSNQSFECFGNVLINQNDTYAYGNRAEYNRDNSTATLYSDLIKVVDGDAIMYSYNCTFNTADNIGYFHDGCYIDKGENHLEAERGYYNTKTHDLIAVDRVEMRDGTYLMTGDSVIFNTETEDAQYFTNTNIWNDKDEYLFANEGIYTKSRDLHYLTRDAYILSPEREIWSDTIEYYRTDGHIIGRRNIQMNDTTQKVLGFADYGEWWDEPGNAFFTRRPSMINYDPEQPDSLFLSADTLWLYTIPVLPPVEDSDSLATGGRDSLSQDENVDDMVGGDRKMFDGDIQTDSVGVATSDVVEQIEEAQDEVQPKGEDQAKNKMQPKNEEQTKGDVLRDMPQKDNKADRGERRNGSDKSNGDVKADNTHSTDTHKRGTMRDVGSDISQLRDKQDASLSPNAADSVAGDKPQQKPQEISVDDVQETESEVVSDSTIVAEEQNVVLADTIVDSLDSVKVLTAKQLRYRAKLEKRRVRDSIRAVERGIRDSLDSLVQIERDSIKRIEDSLLRIKIDTIIAQRIARSSQLADEEAARLTRIKAKADERYRRKIDKAKARALRRGKEYKGPEYTIDSLSADSLSREDVSMEMNDSLSTDSLGRDSMALDSMGGDSVIEKPFPEDSTYKMIKAYRNVKMYRSDSQLVSDSLILLNTDSIIRLYKTPIMWNEGNQITSDSMAIYTQNQLISKANFMGNPIMAMEIDTMYYNQVKGKDMTAYFADGAVYRNDVVGNAQTIYYMQNEDSPEVTGLMYIESASITFYLVDKEIDKITYKQNPTYVLYPMGMIPETQDLRLKDFEWFYSKRPLRDSVCDRTIRPTRRSDASVQQKPRFRITERIDYDRRRLVENGVWVDRMDLLTPDVIEWRNTRTSYKK